MKDVFVAGMGAVSPAGWGAAALVDAAGTDRRLEGTYIERPVGGDILVNQVPMMPKALFSELRHPRLRRVSAISRFGVFAAMEALKEAAGVVDLQSSRIGVIFCSTCGCVTYSRRFYQEALDDPALASPLLFPETVFNAPSSHLATIIGNTAANYTMVGDSGIVMQAVAMGANWLVRGELDACLVVASEESDWLIADAFRYFSKNVPVADGAGALVLTTKPGCGPRLRGITDPFYYGDSGGRVSAIKNVFKQLVPSSGIKDTELSGGLCGVGCIDRAESTVWDQWHERRVDAKICLGEGFSAAAMWQVLVGLRRLQQPRNQQVIVSIPGSYQFAIGAQFSN
jgi:hypothetical protein